MFYYDVDYYFNYKYLLRFILVHRLNCFANTYTLPFLHHLVISFSINELADLHDVRTFNYIFLFRFFFGNRFFFTKFNSAFTAGRTLYNFNLQCYFVKRFAYFPFLFLVNDILFLTSNNHYSYYFCDNIFGFSLYDMNLFLEKKNSLGLFSLRDFLQYRLYFSCKNFKFYFILMEMFKVIRV